MKDNPPIDLSGFELGWLATRFVFQKLQHRSNVFLFYGNSQAAVTSIRSEPCRKTNVLTADKATATLGPEERLKSASWTERQKPGQGGWILWGVLAFVVGRVAGSYRADDTEAGREKWSDGGMECGGISRQITPTPAESSF
jgi:hypothetical protein